MRAVVRAVLAEHPVVAFVLVVVRWLIWTLIGHPVLALISVVAITARPPMLWSMLAVAAVIDAAVTMILRYGNGTTLRPLWIWHEASRFRRDWPARYAEFAVRPGRDVSVVLPGNFYSAPHGFRPSLAAPRLSRLPRSISLTTAAWSIRSHGGQTFEELEEQIHRLPMADDHVLSAHLERVVGPGNRLQLVVIFAAEDGGTEPPGVLAGWEGQEPDPSPNGVGPTPPNFKPNTNLTPNPNGRRHRRQTAPNRPERKDESP